MSDGSPAPPDVGQGFLPGSAPCIFNPPAGLSEPSTASGAGLGGITSHSAEARLLQLLDVVRFEGHASIHSYFLAGLPEQQHILQLGVTALQLLFLSPLDGQLVKASLLSRIRETAAPTSRQRDLLPLPLPPIGAALQLLEQCVRSPSGLLTWSPGPNHKKRKQKQQKLIMAGTAQLWRFLVVATLNGEYIGWNGVLFPLGDSAPSSSQQAALRNISCLVEYFVRSPLDLRVGRCFEELVRSKGVDYAGEEVLHALPVRLGEILPGLPADNVAGTLKAASVASGDVLKWLQNPMECILPEDQWPDPLPSASMNCEKSEWPMIARVLVEKRILTPIDSQDIFKVRGKPLLNGIFSVEKKGAPAPGQCRITRLIMNCVPSNSIQRLMTGDLPTLSSSSQWTAAYLRPTQVLLWSGDDQRGAFYAWALPEAWRPFLAFRWPVQGKDIGLPSKGLVYLASAVIPMGWVNAVSLFQHLHRQLGISPVPAGAGLPQEMEWRRDCPVPLTATEINGGWIQYYLDDFDCPEFVARKDWKALQGTLSATHRRQRAAYERQGVGISEDKAHQRELSVNRMGAHIDGDRGFISVPPEKLLEVGWMCAWMCGQSCASQKALLMTLGRLVRCFEFRRPLMGLLNEVWPRGNWFFKRSLRASATRELIRALCCLPLAVSSIRTPPNGMITCSDASLLGAGLCASAGLTEEGNAVLGNLRAGDVPAFRPAGAATYNKGTGVRVLAMSLFDGLGALVCALARLPCQVVGYASAEIDKDCKKVTRRRWPGILELGSVLDVDRAVVEKLHRSLQGKVDLVVVGAGSPCQDLKAPPNKGLGLQGERSKLFLAIPRIICLLKEVFSVPVHFFVEKHFQHDGRESQSI